MPSDASDPPISTVFATVVASLDLLVIERKLDGTLEFSGHLPEWVISVFGSSVESAVEASPFLQHFLNEIAEPLWQGAPSAPVSSGIWAEHGGGVSEDLHHFEATAIHDDNGGQIVVIKRLGDAYDEVQQLTQRANENALRHRNLFSEVQKKDVLLKCIVHDLNNPLGAVLLNLELLARSDDQNVNASATLALEAARRQRSLIKSITEVFSSDLSRMGRSRECVEEVSELVLGAEHVVQTHLNEALRRSVSILLEDGLSGTGVGQRKVICEFEPFVRAVENLILNALRYAPKDSTVKLSLSKHENGVRIQVCDNGKGVEPELVSSLFDPFTQGRTNQGSMGLGLYFCRMTIEQWGGRITYETAPEGGACFVFTLPWVQSAPPKADEDS